MVLNVIYGAVWLVVAATLMAYVLRVPVGPWWGRAVSAGGVAFFLAATLATAAGPFIALDFQSFWTFGGVLLAGRDPVAWLAEDPLPPLNPPTAYPLFAAFALLPRGASLVAWSAVSAGVCLALVPVALRTLADRGVPGARDLPGWGLALTAAAFALSNAPRSMLQSGQLAAAGALGLTAALAAQSRDRPGRAGAWLALGTIKPNTAAPFLLLFLRRRDLRAWLVLAAVCVAACAAGGWASDPGRSVSVYLETLRKHARPGAVNDVGFSGPQTAGMVGLDYALYRLGFRTPRSLAVAQAAVLLPLGAALALRLVRGHGGLPTGGDCAQVALFSTIFLYHRTHDFTVLALPLTYAVIRARNEAGKARGAYVLAVASVLLALAHQRKAVELLEAALKSRHDFVALVVQAVALPYATWLVLAAMLALALGDRWAAARGRVS
jgi:hypothetical protein